MLQAHPHAIHFKHILYFGEGQGLNLSTTLRPSDLKQSGAFTVYIDSITV